MSITPANPTGTIPIPIAIAAPSIGNGALGPWSYGMQSAGTAVAMNQYAFSTPVVAGQAGCGGYAVVSGLTVSTLTGLNVAIAGGIALLDGWFEFVTSGTATGPQVLLNPSFTVADNATNYVWLTEVAGSTTPIVGVAINTTYASPPTNAKLLLAIVTAASGAVTTIDYSGVCFMNGSDIFRYTSDVGAPIDTPPSSWRGYTVTTLGTYYWNGSVHLPLPSPVQVTYNFQANANLTLAQPQYAAQVLILTDTHPYLTGGVNVVYPAIQTGIIALYNDTVQTLTILVSGGTGFTVATGKRVMFYVDGVDCRQLAIAF